MDIILLIYSRFYISACFIRSITNRTSCKNLMVPDTWWCLLDSFSYATTDVLNYQVIKNFPRFYNSLQQSAGCNLKLAILPVLNFIHLANTLKRIYMFIEI